MSLNAQSAMRVVEQTGGLLQNALAMTLLSGRCAKCDGRRARSCHRRRQKKQATEFRVQHDVVGRPSNCCNLDRPSLTLCSDGPKENRTQWS
jgi:hypothetical protein